MKTSTDWTRKITCFAGLEFEGDLIKCLHVSNLSSVFSSMSVDPFGHRFVMKQLTVWKEWEIHDLQSH